MENFNPFDIRSASSGQELRASKNIEVNEKPQSKRKLFVALFLLIVFAITGLSIFVYSNRKPLSINYQPSTITHPPSGPDLRFGEPPGSEKALLGRRPTPYTLAPIPSSKVLSNDGYHIFQTFNNCGPAALSMTLRFYEVNVTQAELGLALRPYQVPGGDNDDKSVTLEELAEKSKEYGFVPTTDLWEILI